MSCAAVGPAHPRPIYKINAVHLRSMTACLLLVDVVLRTTALGGLPQGFGEGDETEFSAYPLAGVRYLRRSLGV